MQGAPVHHTRPWGRLILAALVVALVLWVSNGSTPRPLTKAPAPATSSELQAARAELLQRAEELKLRGKELEAVKQQLGRVQQRLDEVESAHKAHAVATPAPTSTAHHEHEGMQTLDPNRDVLHPKVGRNELNKWSDMKIDRNLVREMARVSDSHICRVHSFRPFFNESDPLCTLDISQHLAKLPLNVTIERSQFEVFHYVPNCPPLLARQICDLVQGYERLTQLITERSAQQPLPPAPAVAPRKPSEVSLAFVIMAHRAEFLLSTSVESIEKLLRRLVHPNDVIVLHLDRGSGGMFAEVSAAMVLAENFSSVVREILDPYCIASGGASQTEAQLTGFRRALELSSEWSHVVYLSGLDFPLRTRDELVAYLKPGVSYFTLKELDERAQQEAYEQYWRDWWVDCANPTGNQLFRLATRRPLPGLAYAHSDNVYALSRELATWLATDEFAQLLWLYFRTTRHAQEHYLPTAVATDRRFLQRIERTSIILFELNPAPKSLSVHECRHFKNTTEDQAIIKRAHDSGQFFFVHRPRPSLYKYIDSVRDPSFINNDPPPAKGHEH